MNRKADPTPISDAEILNLYWEGYTIERLTRLVSYNERCTKGEAKQRVEQLVYRDIMENPM